MFEAINKEGITVSIDEVSERKIMNKGKPYTCPICGEEVIPRMGVCNAWHFAHKSNTECDPEGQSITNASMKCF